MATGAQTRLIRVATPADMAEIDLLFARSYGALVRPDYPPSVMVTAVPILARAQPHLLASGRYFVAEKAGRIVGAGGWSPVRTRRRGRPVSGQVRHLLTDRNHLRQGVARAIMQRVFDEARAAGLARLGCLSTRTAVPFYKACGFVVLGEAVVPLRPGIEFPVVEMLRQL